MISNLIRNEEQAIIEGLAMMSYNSSIKRVLQKGGVDIFVRLMVEEVEKLKEIDSQDEFDEWHRLFIETTQKKIKTNRGKSLSYGQAQKPLNVFLKVYVDWANRPDVKRAQRLRKFLHLPLDSIVMGEFKNQFSSKWKEYVVTAYDAKREKFKRALVEKGKKVSGADLRRFINPSNFSLSGIISEEMYYAWQQCARAIYPEKPVLLDVLWSLNRRA